MNRVFLDTNILLDMLVSDRPGHADALALCSLAAHGIVDCAIASVSLKDMYYITRHVFNEQRRRDLIRWMLRMFDVQPVTAAICLDSVDSDEPDYEDGLIRACAEHWGADVIVTRDAAHEAFVHGVTPVMDATDFMRRHNAN